MNGDVGDVIDHLFSDRRILRMRTLRQSLNDRFSGLAEALLKPQHEGRAVLRPLQSRDQNPWAAGEAGAPGAGQTAPLLRGWTRDQRLVGARPQPRDARPSPVIRVGNE